jgi:hypothetical protein
MAPTAPDGQSIFGAASSGQPRSCAGRIVGDSPPALADLRGSVWTIEYVVFITCLTRCRDDIVIAKPEARLSLAVQTNRSAIPCTTTARSRPLCEGDNASRSQRSLVIGIRSIRVSPRESIKEFANRAERDLRKAYCKVGG